MEADYTQIVTGCRHHDRKAQRALYDAMAPMAMGVCMRFARSRPEAQDLMQDGFIRVFEKIGKLDNPESLGAWVYHIMLNTCINHYQRTVRMESIEEHRDAFTPLATPPDDPFSNEEVVLALQQITPQQRLVFNLVDVEGMDEQSVSKQLGCKLTTVRSLRSKAKKNLQEILLQSSPNSPKK